MSQSRDSKEIQGYCFVCARELGIQPVNEMMDNMMNTIKQQTGMSDEEIKEATEQIAQMMESFPGPQQDSGDEDEGEDALFAPGGAATLPVDQMLGGRPGENGGVGGAGVQQKKESFHKKKRKFITNFCTDLTAKARSGGLDNIIGREKEIQRVCRSSPAGRKTTPASSASPVWARPPWLRAWPCASPGARCPPSSRRRRSSCWTSPPWWPAPSLGASSRAGSRAWWTR